MEDFIILLNYLAALLAVLALGCIIADYILPHIPFLDKTLCNLPEYEDDLEHPNVIAFPYDDSTERWGIWALRSSGSVFGAAESWVHVHGEMLIFPSFTEAATAAETYNSTIGTENLFYMPRAV